MSAGAVRPRRRLDACLGITSCLGITIVALSTSSCCATPQRKTTPHCETACLKRSCADLDERLLQARQPLLDCIAREGRRSHIGQTHRCYRALRLIESARWWLRTLNASLGIMPPVYKVPTESLRQEFLCRIERLAAARTPHEVQRRYLEMVAAYP